MPIHDLADILVAQLMIVIDGGPNSLVKRECGSSSGFETGGNDIATSSKDLRRSSRRTKNKKKYHRENRTGRHVLYVDPSMPWVLSDTR